VSDATVVGSPQWLALMDEGRALREGEEAFRWQLGDWAIRVAGLAGTRASNAGRDGLLRAAAWEIGIEEDALQSYRSVATAWKSDARRTSVPWTIYRLLQTRDDRYARLADVLSQIERGQRPSSRAVQAQLRELDAPKPPPGPVLRVVEQARPVAPPPLPVPDPPRPPPPTVVDPPRGPPPVNAHARRLTVQIEDVPNPRHASHAERLYQWLNQTVWAYLDTVDTPPTITDVLVAIIHVFRDWRKGAFDDDDNTKEPQ
jgi:hypothetical protein